MDTSQITKAEALHAFHGNVTALGRALGVSRQAIYQFNDGPLPEKHALKLKFVILPEMVARLAGLCGFTLSSTSIDDLTRKCKSEISDGSPGAA